ncbi:Eukaryotic translation initiation factor 3 subunit C [Gossypium arboreum]|uniref:Eukaryotic translation initiation factor 3 subunit C n=1 Tax=Gossypium arboreum TaxID=29729 RepID=A0A0B0NSC4_GOSAR|nr:Eukaryotic translation initiation factor 3 subunit C [Gossypium arboreum]
MSRAMNSTVVNDTRYYKSCTSKALAFGSLSIRTHAFTYIKVYESHIPNLSSTQDLGMPHYECHSINEFRIYSFWVLFDVLSYNKASPQLDLIDDILVFQPVYSFSIRLRTCLGSSTNTSCLFVL